MTKIPPNVMDLSVDERADLALRIAVEKVILAHAESGLPLYVLRDGSVAEVAGEELRKAAAQILAY